MSEDKPPISDELVDALVQQGLGELQRNTRSTEVALFTAKRVYETGESTETAYDAVLKEAPWREGPPTPPDCKVCSSPCEWWEEWQCYECPCQSVSRLPRLIEKLVRAYPGGVLAIAYFNAPDCDGISIEFKVGEHWKQVRMYLDSDEPAWRDAVRALHNELDSVHPETPVGGASTPLAPELETS